MQNSPSREATSCSATHSIPCLLHNTSVHYYFHYSPTHTLSPNPFSPPTFCSHIYFSLNNTAITARMFSALQTQCWHNKIRDKKVRHPQIKQSLIKCTDLKLTQTTPDEAPTQNLTNLIPNYEGCSIIYLPEYERRQWADWNKSVHVRTCLEVSHMQSQLRASLSEWQDIKWTCMWRF